MRRFYQTWAVYTPAVKHMWRFFIRHQDALLDELSPASYRAWSACWQVFNRSTDQDKAIAEWYFSSGIGPARGDVPNAVVEKTIARLCRLLAVQYGLADDTAYPERGGGVNPEPSVNRDSDPEKVNPDSPVNPNARIVNLADGRTDTQFRVPDPGPVIP